MGPQFSNQDSRLGPVTEKAKKLSTLQYPRSVLVMTSVVLISKGQPCPTSSVVTSLGLGEVLTFVIVSVGLQIGLC